MSFNHPVYERLKKFKFILASSSPRRLEIINNNLHIEDVHIIPSNFEENLSKLEYSIEGYVMQTSSGKAEAVFNQLLKQGEMENFIILSSDTIIACNDKIFEKPITKERQLEMLHTYRSNPSIKVITSINLIKYKDNQKVVKTDIERTNLKFNEDLSDDFLNYYINSEEGLNVAGGFKYQNLGSLLFKSIEGDYFNVVGLPVNKTFQLLDEILANE